MSTQDQLTRKELVKVFTRVPPQFVDDFYDILSAEALDNNFVIDLENACKWLDTRKDRLVKTLKESYKHDVDYKVIRIKKELSARESRGGHNHQQIMLTIDCFKRLCMRSRTAKAETVRTYFIEIDNFVKKYSQQIMNGIIADIESTADTMLKKKNDQPGYMYIVNSDDRMPYLNKPGAAQNIIDRLRAYNVGRPKDIKLLYAIQVKRRKEVETCVKSILKTKQYIKKREVFNIDAEIITKIINSCDKLSTILHHKQMSGKMKGQYYLVFMNENILRNKA